MLILMLLTFKGYGLTHEQKIVALTILGEARGEGKAGMYAVACVIQQRVLNRSMSAARVCKQRKQFSCWNSKRDLSYLLKSSSAPYAILLAKNLKQLDLKYINHADHYCSLKTNNYWTRSSKVIKIINNHKFYRLKK